MIGIVYPQRGVAANGASVRAGGLAQGLAEHGFPVVSVPLVAASGGTYRRYQQPARRVATERFDVVIACGIELAHVVRASPPAATVLDVCDSVLAGLVLRWRNGDRRALGGAVNACRLLRGVRDRASLLLYVTATDLEDDRPWLRRSPKALVVGNGVSDEVRRVRPVAEGGHRIAMLADYSYPPNRAGLEWFLAKVWPEVERLPWRLTLFGPAAPPLTLPAGVEYAGFAEDLAHTYAATDVCIAPTTPAPGFKNKVAEALAAARPVLATSYAARGQVASSGLCVSDHAADWIEALGRLSDARELRRVSEEMARERRGQSWYEAVEPLCQELGRLGIRAADPARVAR